MKDNQRKAMFANLKKNNNSITKNIPKNPYKKKGITDKEFKDAIIEDRKYRQKKYGNYHIMR